MRDIQPSQFARIMTLPWEERMDLLEFLGATPVPDRQIDSLIAQVGRHHKLDAQARSGARPEGAARGS